MSPLDAVRADACAASAPATNRPLPALAGRDRAEFAGLVEDLGEKPFRAGQLWHWVYCRGARDFDAMTTLAKSFRARLAESWQVGRPGISKALQSVDGTQKWLLRMDDGAEIECVHIPDADRGALCVSSQVGCTLTCKFCHTGTQRLVRNLTAAEIVGQVMHALDALGEWPAGGGGGGGGGGDDDAPRMLSNLVFMGMGEPLYNYDNVAKAMKIIMDPEGLAISKRRITLSTSGVVPMIERCGAELGVNLAISLHAVTDALRDVIVPINKKWPIAELLQACRTYPGVSNARRITFEYVMLKGINDSDADARELCRLLDGIHAKINLIPFNPWPGAPYECSSNTRIQQFGDLVNSLGYASPVRTPRGRDILAACGQLKSESERISRAEADRRAEADAARAAKEAAAEAAQP